MNRSTRREAARHGKIIEKPSKVFFAAGAEVNAGAVQERTGEATGLIVCHLTGNWAHGTKEWLSWATSPALARDLARLLVEAADHAEAALEAQK